MLGEQLKHAVLRPSSVSIHSNRTHLCILHPSTLIVHLIAHSDLAGPANLLATCPSSTVVYIWLSPRIQSNTNSSHPVQLIHFARPTVREATYDAHVGDQNMDTAAFMHAMTAQRLRVDMQQAAPRIRTARRMAPRPLPHLADEAPLHQQLR